MSVSSTIAEFRTDLATNSSQLPDSQALRWYNDGRDELIDRIIREKEDYFYDIFTTDLVFGKNEYAFNKRGDLASDVVTVLNGIAKTKSISVKFKSSDASFVKLENRTQDNLDYDVSDYSDTTVPFYTVSDNSWFIYPTPTEDVAGGIKAYVITFPKKLALGDAETLSDTFSKAIRYYFFARFYETSHRINEAETYDAKFKREIDKIAVSVGGRIPTPKQIKSPSLRNYK